MAGVLPLVAIAWLDLKRSKSEKEEENHLKYHAMAVGVFLVVAHIAMIFGMLSPDVLGYVPMDVDASSMPSMSH